MNYICTWLYADQIGEESKYLQTGEVSSSQKHQNIYWRCVMVFFTISKYQHSQEKHLFFTNLDQLPVVDGIDLSEFFKNFDVEVIETDFKYKTPKDYYWAWQNQFYEFSILEYIKNRFNDTDSFLILDSDCIFLKPATELFEKAVSNDNFSSYTIDYREDTIVNGINRLNMKEIYKDLLQVEDVVLPEYHAGEFFLSSVRNIKKIHHDFLKLWPVLLKRHEKGLLKFNEEAHTLSYLYYTNNFKGGDANTYIRRIWTNFVFYRNVRENDLSLSIWHLPAEKTLGIKKLYYILKEGSFTITKNPKEFILFLSKHFGIPKLSVPQRIQYYTSTYTNAISKKWRNNFRKTKVSS